MTIVRRASPLGEFVSLRQAMDRLLEDNLVRARAWVADPDRFGPAVDITDGADALRVEAALPGFRPEDVDITVEDGILRIRAESSSEGAHGEGEKLVSEIRRGSVARIIALPKGLEPEAAEATFENGVLSLRIPRAEAVKPHHIKITPTTDATASQVETAPAEGASDA